MQLIDKYMIFYLNGREEELFDDDDVDEHELADKAMAGEDPRKLALEAAGNLAAPLRNSRKEWIADHKEDVAEAGGDERVAFDHYVQGRIDQYAHSLEEDIVTAMFEDSAEDDDDDDEEDDD